jgi:DNA mismatch endonuclease (patch repair protein)
MPDVHSPEQRKKNMSAISSKDTKPEIFIRNELHKRGYRYRKNAKDLPGKPDIVLPKYKAVIFVNGCFWHKHECHLFRLPSTRTEWWAKKLEATRLRDKSNIEVLNLDGWKVLVIWECAIKGKYKRGTADLFDSITYWISEGQDNLEITHTLY